MVYLGCGMLDLQIVIITELALALVLLQCLE